MVLDFHNYNVPVSVKTNSLYWGQFHCSWLKCIFMLNINVGILWLLLAVKNYRDITWGWFKTNLPIARQKALEIKLSATENKAGD